MTVFIYTHVGMYAWMCIHTYYYIILFFMFFKDFSYAYQACIYFIKQFCEILLQFK